MIIQKSADPQINVPRWALAKQAANKVSDRTLMGGLSTLRKVYLQPESLKLGIKLCPRPAFV